MMTIKEFASLCNCTTQTLRYYDKINLLKPVKVDQWSGYRYYTKSQAIDFVKIKNLQAADFTIEESWIQMISALGAASNAATTARTILFCFAENKHSETASFQHENWRSCYS